MGQRTWQRLPTTPGLPQCHWRLAARQHGPPKEALAWTAIATGRLMAMRPSEECCSSSPQQGREDCCIPRKSPAEDVASGPLGPWSIWRLVYHFMHWRAGNHNELQRARVQPQIYKEERIKSCNVKDQGCFEIGHTHLARNTLNTAALISLECINVQSGNICCSAGTTYSTAGDPRGIWGFLDFFEHFLLSFFPLSFLFFS